jgi:tetratricopeptide (TPR) repeat protein
MTRHRLLAGRLPDVDESSMETYLGGLEKAELLPPSAAMRSQWLHEDAALVADLDAITRKAIRYRAEDRYPSADALASDLRRALAKLPVGARRSTLRYRVNRFVRRHRSLVLGSSLATVMLIVGVVVMVNEGRIARAESVRADAGIEQERVLAHLLLFDYFGHLKRIPGSTDAQRRAVSQALRYLDSLNRGLLNPALQLDTIKAYTEMGLLQGSQYEENLGDTKGSIVTLTKAVASARDLVSHDSGNPKYLLSEAAAEKALGQVYFGIADKTKAIEHLTLAADISQRISTIPGVTSDVLMQAASTVDNLGDTLGLPGVGTMNDPVKAIARYQEAASVYRDALKLDPKCMNCARGVVVEDYKLGTVTDDKAQAAVFDSDGLAVIAALPTSEQATSRIIRADNLLRQNLGVLYVDAGRSAEGLALMLAARQRLQAIVKADAVDARAQNDLALFDGKLATAYDDLRQYQQESDVLKEFVQIMEGLGHKDPANGVWRFRLALAQSRYAQVELRLGHAAAAERAARESLAVLVPLAQKPDAEPRVLSITADALVNLRPSVKEDVPLAVSFAQRALQGKPQPEAEDYLILAAAQRLAGDLEETKRAAQGALNLIPAHSNSVSDGNQRASATAFLNGGGASVAVR